MRRNLPITLMLVTALVAAAATLTVEHLLHPASAVAQEATSPLDDLTVFATSYGVSSQHFRSFIFVNQQTGDIWVYLNEKLRKHYLVGTMGEKLEEIKN